MDQYLPGLWRRKDASAQHPQLRQIYPGFIGPSGTLNLPTRSSDATVAGIRRCSSCGTPGETRGEAPVSLPPTGIPPSVPAGVSTADAGPAPPAVPAPAAEKGWRPQFHSRPAGTGGAGGRASPGSSGGGGGSGGSSGGADDGGGSDGGGGGGGRSLGGGGGDDDSAAGGAANVRVRRVIGGSSSALATPPRPTRRATGEGVALGGEAAPNRADLGPLAAARAFEREMDALLDQILAEGGLESGGEDEGGAEGVAEGDAESPAPPEGAPAAPSAYSEAREIDLALNRLKPHATRPAAFEIDLQGERYVVGGTKGGTQYVFRVPDEGTPWPGGLTRRSASHNWRGAAVPPRYMQEAVAGAP